MIIQAKPIPYYEVKPNCQCPLCKAHMQIAGRFEKGEVEGKSKLNQYECYNCGKIVTPEKLT